MAATVTGFILGLPGLLLAAGGRATPMTYRAGGRQMVVVAAVGHGSLGTALGDAVVAYAQPPSK